MADVVPAAALALPTTPLHLADPGLVLRAWGAGADDAAALAAAWADPDIRRWTAVPDQHDAAAAARWISGEGTRRASGRALDLVVTDSHAPEEVHGEVGLAVVDPGRRWAEVGYWLFPAWRGRGRAAAALELFTGWALADLGIERLFARTAADNPASAGVARRAGYELAGTLPDGTSVWIRDR